MVKYGHKLLYFTSPSISAGLLLLVLKLSVWIGYNHEGINKSSLG